MKHITRLFIALFAFANLAQAAEKNHLVIVNSFQKPPTVAHGKPLEKQIQQLSENGFSPYLIQTDDYPPLRKGLWAIVLGPFDAETAKAKQQNVQTWVKDAYIKTVKPPQPQSAGYGFSTLNSLLDEDNCIALEENERQGLNFLCSGFSGHAVYIYTGDHGTKFTVSPPQDEIVEIPILDGAMPSSLHTGYPLTWIYRADKLLALAGVFVTDNPNTNVFIKYQQLIYMGNTQLCPVEKVFKADNLDEVLTYLNDNPSNCPYRNAN